MNLTSTMSSDHSRTQRYDPAGQIVSKSILASNYPAIDSVAAYALRSVGKNFRARMCLEIAETLTPGAVVPHSLVEVLELLQYFTLVHDDIVDRSQMRRGNPSLWAKFGPDISLLFGDFMHARVFEWLSQDPDIPANSRTSAIGAFAEASRQVQEGQMLEILNLYNTDFSEDQYFQVARAKTSSLIYLAAYLAWLASARDRRVLNRLRAFADHFGIAFQIYNDMTDFQSGHGKDTLTDVFSGRMTLPVILHLAAAVPNDPLLCAYNERKLDHFTPAGIRNVLETSGCLYATYQRMKAYLSVAERELVTALADSIPTSIRQIFNTLLTVRDINPI